MRGKGARWGSSDGEAAGVTRVLVVGGEKDFLSMNWLASSEVYDPGDLATRG